MRRLLTLLTLLPAPLMAHVHAPVSPAASPADDPRLTALFEADQRDRAPGLAADPGKVATADPTTIGQPQVYGTQYLFPRGKPAKQEPYDRALIGDDQRRAVDVEPSADQAAKLRRIERERVQLLPSR